MGEARSDDEIRAGLAEYTAAFNRTDIDGTDWCVEVGGPAVDLAEDVPHLLDDRDALAWRLAEAETRIENAQKIVHDWANDRGDHVALITLPVRVAAALAVPDPAATPTPHKQGEQR